MTKGPTSPWTVSTTTDRAAYLAVALAPGIGIGRLHSLLSVCCTPRGALEAPFEFLCTIPGISRSAATGLAQRTLADGERVMAELARLGAVALLPADELYPASLREIPDAPTVLFARGHLELLVAPAVAIVGSRDHTAYGADVCRMIARAAAERGITVVSGMARGLDAVAHRSALEAGGTTIGVLGNGLGVIYPAANRTLYEAVGADGLLLTEFPPGERPFVGSFPRRNRLISGLARVTVVAEAAHGSGALITAGTALDQGRDVMAVPGPITSRTSAGTNALLRDGAEPLLAMEDLLAHYPDAVGNGLQLAGNTYPAAGASAPATRSAAAAASIPAPEPAPVPVPAEFSAIAGCLGRDLVHIDAISIVSGQPPGEVLAVLAQLELIGAVEQQPGGLFRRL